jgi:hypothetical protein
VPCLRSPVTSTVLAEAVNKSKSSPPNVTLTPSAIPALPPGPSPSPSVLPHSSPTPTPTARVNTNQALKAYGDAYRANVQVRNHSPVEGSFQPSQRAGEHKRRIVIHRDRIWDLSANHFLPLIKAIGRNQASSLSEGLGRRRIDGFNPRVDRPVRNFWIFSPVRDQTPSQRIQASLFGLRIIPNGENVLAWRDIPTDRQVLLWWYWDVIAPSSFWRSWRVFRTASLITLPSISIVPLLGAGGSTPMISFSSERISWNLGAADEPTQDNSAVT